MLGEAFKIGPKNCSPRVRFDPIIAGYGLLTQEMTQRVYHKDKTSSIRMSENWSLKISFQLLKQSCKGKLSCCFLKNFVAKIYVNILYFIFQHYWLEICLLSNIICVCMQFQVYMTKFISLAPSTSCHWFLSSIQNHGISALKLCLEFVWIQFS